MNNTFKDRLMLFSFPEMYLENKFQSIHVTNNAYKMSKENIKIEHMYVFFSVTTWRILDTST